jgi:hypothetical protein
VSRRASHVSGAAIEAGNAKDLLKEAAEAVGMDPKALAQLAVDAYGSKLVDKQTESITRKELGLTLWRELQAIDKANRGDWYQKLADEQQVSLIVALRHEGYRSDVIARDLKISQYTVTELYNRYADTVGSQVSFIRINTILGIMTNDLELAQEGLRKDGDWGGFWRARKEYIKLLQDLGIVERAVQRIEVVHNFEQAKQAEIESILELERKKKVRLEEIKRAEFTVTSDDRVPQIGSGS